MGGSECAVLGVPSNLSVMNGSIRTPHTWGAGGPKRKSFMFFPLRRAALACAFVSAAAAFAPRIGFAAPPSLVSARFAPAVPSASSAPASTVRAQTFSVCDIDLVLDQTFANPHDPDEITVDAVFTLAGTKTGAAQTLRVPAFWYEPFAPKTSGDGRVDMAATGAKTGWRVRFCPTEAGRWTMAVRAKNKDGEKRNPTPLVFTVTKSGKPGMVRRAKGSNRYFAYDNKTPFFLVGENVCWADKRGLAAYDDWFPKLSKAGGNFARLWMAFQPIESKASGLNHYDNANAAYFDAVLQKAQQNRLVCMMAFGTYGEFTTGGFFNEGQWPQNPYNKANGGPCETPDDFWTNETARTLYKKKLRYLIARYGAYPSLGFWEFWNEQDAPAMWLHEMGAYVKSVDPYHHLVTNSAGTVARDDSWRVPEMDLTQTHRYGDEGSIADIAPTLPPDQSKHDIFNKPHLLGEFGISWRNSDAKFDPDGQAINFHNGLWAGTMSGNAGGGVLWWWDNYVGPQNLYGEFTPLAAFAKTVPWTTRTFEQIPVPTPTTALSGPETYTNAVLNATGGWGAKSTGPVIVGGDGSVSGTGTVLGTLYGPSKAEFRSPLTLEVNLPKSGQLTVHVIMVSDSATLRVLIDGKEAASFPFNAAPGKGEGYVSTKQFPEYDNIYQAVFDTNRTVEIPQGKHAVTLENASGDWLQIDTLILTNAVSSRFAPLTPYALQDAPTGETLLWLQDPASRWKPALANEKPTTFRGVSLKLPVSRSGAYQAVWWDTRKGVVVQSAPAKAAGGSIVLIPPAFERDIALHLIPSALPRGKK